MMTTVVDICNLALARVGNAAQVTSVSPPDGSGEAQYCLLFYPQAVNMVLERHAWTFATVTAAGTQASENNNPAWSFAYTLPSDFFRLVDVRAAFVPPCPVPFYGNANVFVDAARQSLEFELSAGVLYCNFDAINLVYVSTLDISADLYDSLFVECVTWVLASYLAGVLIKGDVGVSAAQRCIQAFENALTVAATRDGQGVRKKQHYVPQGIAARF